MSRQQRAGAALSAMVPVTVAAVALRACGCGVFGLALEIVTVLIYGVWIELARE